MVIVIKKHTFTILLLCALVILSVWSLFIGVLDITLDALLRGDLEAAEIFLISRLPRLLAILCTGVGMSVAGLIMQHFSMVLRGRYELVYWVAPLVILAFVFANHLNIVGMGKDFSKNLGVPYNLVLFMGLSIAAMITASVVVVVGSFSYIGLIVPNLVSMFKGDKIRSTLADTALFGSIFVLVRDTIAMVVIAPYEQPIELIIGIVGSVVFIAMLLYRLNYGRKAVRLAVRTSAK